MQIEKLERHKAALESKAEELIRALRGRKLTAMEYTPEACEQGVLAAQRDLAVVILDRESRLLREVKAALARIADGTYGNCEACEEGIKPKRLDAVPWTRYCLQCQESIDRGPSPAGAEVAYRLPVAA